MCEKNVAVESETEPKGERRVDSKVGLEGETSRGSRGACLETELGNLWREDMGGT